MFSSDLLSLFFGTFFFENFDLPEDFTPDQNVLLIGFLSFFVVVTICSSNEFTLPNKWVQSVLPFSWSFHFNSYVMLKFHGSEGGHFEASLSSFDKS